jgi:hypothetical protein
MRHISTHPYVKVEHPTHAGGMRPNLSIEAMVDEDYLPDIVNAETALLDDHIAAPIDAFVGEDVSGRVPTLVTHKLFEQAHATGQIASRPKTYFMSSGRLWGPGLEEKERQWADNLADYVALSGVAAEVSKARVITDFVDTGESSGRLVNALRQSGIEDVSTVEPLPDVLEYLSCSDDTTGIRRMLGVTKVPLQPLAGINSHASPTGKTELRIFLEDYADYIYWRIFNEEPPRRIHSPKLHKIT